MEVDRAPRRPGIDVADRPLLIARLLGRFSVTLDGQLVDTLSSRRTRHVLAYLLAHRATPVQRDVLMDVFWPHAAPDAARNCLHVALTGVRQALREVSPQLVLERRNDTYRIADSVQVWIDVEQFERHARLGRQAERTGDTVGAAVSYEAAGQAYEGDFLADDPYADWAGARRDALRLAAVDVQSRLIELYAAQGDDGPATLLGRQLLTIDPCNEPVHRRLMSSYARSGQVHLALAQYQRCAEALSTSYGVSPSPQTTELYERLRRSCGRPSWGSKQRSMPRTARSYA